MHSDQCVLMKKYENANGDVVIVALIYVDAILFVSNNDVELQACVEEFFKHFEGRDEGPISWYLGIRIAFMGDTCTLSQPEYIRALLQDFGIKECHPVSTPMVENFMTNLPLTLTRMSSKERSSGME